MALEFQKESYSGKIKEISLGKGKVVVGGESCYPFYQFEGKMPNRPKIAMEVWDMEPEEWAPGVIAPFKDVLKDPASWAKKCVELGADMIVLQLKSIDPNGKNAQASEVVETVKKVMAAVDVPLVVWGCANFKKDEEVLKKIAEDCQGRSLILGPVEEKNHKGIAAAAMGYGHFVVSSSPIDVNLAKQVNILLENLGMPTDRILIDPTTGGLGYGLEYSYSVMERIRMAALTQNDDKLQYPIINNLGNEIWKSKETKLSTQDAPTLGNAERRGIMMEAVGAVTYAIAGSNILILRHPESVRLVKAFLSLISDGGSAKDLAGIMALVADTEPDLAALAPEPNLTLEDKSKAAAKPEAKEAKKEEAPKAAPAKAQAAPAAPKAEVKAEIPKVAAQADPALEAKLKAEAEAKAKLEADAKAKKDAETKAKADAETKAKAEAAEKVKLKAEAEAKAKLEAEAIAKREAEEEAIRQARAREKEELDAKRQTVKVKAVTMTAAAVQVSKIDRIIKTLDWVHKR